MILTIGDKGEISLTQKLLDHLGLPSGGRIEVELGPEGTLVVSQGREPGEAEPHKSASPKEGGADSDHSPKK